MMIARTLVLALAASGALALATQAGAETLRYTATLDGAHETPPNDSHGHGMADVTYDTETHAISWNVTFDGLTGPATMAHIHGPAPVGKAAGVVVPLGMAPKSPTSGQATLTDVQANDLKQGLLYVNVHTAAHPAGEIRGQLTPAP
ncbi:MAG: CHRD domain-containing protein [Alphaproteobacteria bacterium]|nr:CHRD domain-containing protein [Alphaproteobacteria bacterium]